MASLQEWCSDKLSKLLQEDLRISTLNEIKDHLESLPQTEASRTVHLLDLPLVFDCLNDSNTEQVDLACEVLALCLNNLDIGESTSRYELPLERALNHPHSSVKLMALREIDRNISKEETLVEVCKRTSLLTNIIERLGDSDIAVANRASDILTTVGLSSLGLQTLLSRDILKVLQDVLVINEVVRLRVYELIVNISKESEANFYSLKSTGLLNQIIHELGNNDILLRMNIVELLTQLGLSRHGFDYLDEEGVLDKLFSTLESDDAITVQLCEPGILKFFGHMARWKPIELLSRYPKLFDRMFSNIEKADLTVVGVSLDTLGIIGLSNEGKCTLNATGNKITYAIKTIVRLLPSLPTEVRLRALNCLENLIRVNTKTDEIMEMTRSWYIVFCDNPMEVVLRYAKNPFSEIKFAGLELLQAIAEQQWGQQEIKNTPGLIEYLLNRNTEITKECKEAKFDVIKAMARSPIFDHVTLTKLQAYVKEGPYYVQTITEVALEGED